MATLVNDNYRNAVVGTLIFVNDDGVCLVECDDPFVHYTVPVMVSDPSEAMVCVDMRVCVYEGEVHVI